jgi:hypothetical protein
MNLTKYIRIDTLGFFLWSTLVHVQHADMARALCGPGGLRRVVSAGFVNWDMHGSPLCSGHSTSLDIGVGAADSFDLAVQLGRRPAMPGCSSAAAPGVTGSQAMSLAQRRAADLGALPSLQVRP